MSHATKGATRERAGRDRVRHPHVCFFGDNSGGRRREHATRRTRENGGPYAGYSKTLAARRALFVYEAQWRRVTSLPPPSLPRSLLSPLGREEGTMRRAVTTSRHRR